MHCVFQMLEESLHLHVLKDNLQDARQQSDCMNWAKGIATEVQSLDLQSPFSAIGIDSINGEDVRVAVAKMQHRIWETVHETVQGLLPQPGG